MESPWLFAGFAVAVFLAVQIVFRTVRWAREIQWEVVQAWNHDDSHSGVTKVRVRFPAPGYRVLRRGSRFRAERVDFMGEVVDRFSVRRHMTDAIQDCWDDYKLREAATASYGTGRRDSGLPDGAGSLHTA